MTFGKKILQVLKEYPLALICSALILICVIAIVMRGGAATELSAQEADLNTRIRTIDQNNKNAKNLSVEVNEIQQLVDQIESKLFNRNQRAVNINFFYSLEDRLDVRISNIGQVAAADPIYAKGGLRALKLHSTIVYNISVNASFEDLMAFMFELHRVDPLIRVADFQIAETNSQGAQNALEARLRVIVLAEID